MSLGDPVGISAAGSGEKDTGDAAIPVCSRERPGSVAQQSRRESGW